MALVYSCCFWFSLRLGGILIALFSFFQASVFLIGCCIGYSHSDKLEKLSEWNHQFNLINSEDFLDNFLQDPKKHLRITIVCTSIYLIACILYVYGAYICNNILMLSYILLELIRLILVSVMVATGLLLLKNNTMDIGSLIGASVAGGFFLLGMFYLWICSANLPILINEMEHDEQVATIAKLQHLLDTNQRPRQGYENIRYALADDPTSARNIFVLSNANKPLECSITHRTRIPVS